MLSVSRQLNGMRQAGYQINDMFEEEWIQTAFEIETESVIYSKVYIHRIRHAVHFHMFKYCEYIYM